MIRVLYLITSSNFGGAETLFLQQVCSLRKDRYTPLVCSIKPLGAVARKIEENGIQVSSLNLDLKQTWNKPFALLGKWREFNKLVQSFQPHIIHGSLFQADVLGALVGARQRVPVRIATVHMVLMGKFFELLVERLVSRWVTCYMAISEDIRRFYVRRLFLSSKKTVVIRNAVDPADILARSNQPLPNRAVPDLAVPWIVMVGRLDPQKDIPNLLHAFHTLDTRGVPIGLVLVGDGPDRQKLIDLTQNLGLSSRVRFAGFQENPMPFVKGSLGLVLSSKEEGLPMVILEAMALSKPIISTAVGAVPEVVEDGRTGILVPPKDSSALAQAIERLAMDSKLAEQMGQEGRVVLDQKFSSSVLANSLDDLYDRLLKEKGIQTA